MFSPKFLVVFALALILVVEAQPQSRDRDGSVPVRGKGDRRGGKGKQLDFGLFWFYYSVYKIVLTYFEKKYFSD